MKSNPKKICKARAKSVISHKRNDSIEIPKDSPDSINIFLKDIINKQIPEYKNNFDELYRTYYMTTSDGYKIKYKIIRYTSNNIFLKCSQNNCAVNANLTLLSNDKIGIPDPDGNIIETTEDYNNKFYTEDHKISINLHKEYVKRYINLNYANLTKKEIFNKEENYLYLKMFCRQYYLNNPDKSHDDALTELAKKFNTNYEEEI